MHYVCCNSKWLCEIIIVCIVIKIIWLVFDDGVVS